MTSILKLTALTTDQIREENREYNPSEWDKVINRLIQEDPLTLFYVARKEDNKGYEYDRYYAVYTLKKEGITFFSSVSYHSMLSNSGFCRVIIGDNNIVYKVLLKDASGNEGYCNNDKANRIIMAKNSKNFNAVYTNEF